jgi:hypothetical protein
MIVGITITHTILRIRDAREPSPLAASNRDMRHKRHRNNPTTRRQLSHRTPPSSSALTSSSFGRRWATRYRPVRSRRERPGDITSIRAWWFFTSIPMSDPVPIAFWFTR